MYGSQGQGGFFLPQVSKPSCRIPLAFFGGTGPHGLPSRWTTRVVKFPLRSLQNNCNYKDRPCAFRTQTLHICWMNAEVMVQLFVVLFYSCWQMKPREKFVLQFFLSLVVKKKGEIFFGCLLWFLNIHIAHLHKVCIWPFWVTTVIWLLCNIINDALSFFFTLRKHDTGIHIWWPYPKTLTEKKKKKNCISLFSFLDFKNMYRKWPQLFRKRHLSL